MPDRQPESVTASEIGEFIFCPEAWRLSQVGHASANQTQHASGTRHHNSKAIAERIAGGSIALGRLMIVLALLALAAWALTR